MAIATASTFSTVQCVDGILKDYGKLSVPGSNVASTYTLFAPLVQLNYRAQDQPDNGGGGGGVGGGRESSSIPVETGTSSSSLPSASGGSEGGGNGNGHGSSISEGGLTTGAKVGIGIGVTFALIVVGLLLFLMRRTLQRRRANRPVGEMLPDEKKPIPGQPELEGAEIKELEAISRPQELHVGGGGGASASASASAHSNAGSAPFGARKLKNEEPGYYNNEDDVFELEGSSAIPLGR